MERDRPEMPDGYGVPEHDQGLLDWPQVEERLVASVAYWMATVRPDGRPHVVPRWGVWTRGALYYDGSPETIHARNIRADSRTTLHLEDGTRAVIAEGHARPSEPPDADLGAELSRLITAKYGDEGYAPGPDSWDGPEAGGLCVFTPDKVLAWTSFPTDVTRFRFR